MSKDNKYDDFFETVLSDSEREENSLKDIFTISEEHHKENTKTDVIFLKYFLPKKIREEFIGDMLEDIAEMKSKGYKKWLIRIFIAGQCLVLIFSQIKSLFQITINKQISDK